MAYPGDVSSAKSAYLLSASASRLAHGATRGLNVGTGGTATVTMANGEVCADFPLHTGYNPVSITHLTALGTASDVWALY